MSIETKEYKDYLDRVKVLQKAVVVDSEGNVLVLTRAENDWDKRSGKNDLCGGSINEEEIVPGVQDINLMAIKREVLEETGLSVADIQPVFVGSGVKVNPTKGNIFILGIGYKATVEGIKPEVNVSNEHIQAEWITKEELMRRDFGDDGGFHIEIVKRV